MVEFLIIERMEDRKIHWENIYGTKKFTEVSWYQQKPEVSLDYIHTTGLEKDSAIIDIGGGDSYLVDFLLEEGYSDISVLDISEKALKRAKERLEDKAINVKWIVADAAGFEPQRKYDIWHDRAAFHFLTEKNDIDNYIKNLEEAVNPGGHVILGTFSDKGPEKCSGIYIRQYSAEEMGNLLSSDFELLGCENIDHTTPSGAVQNFIFCRLRKSPLTPKGGIFLT